MLALCFIVLYRLRSVGTAVFTGRVFSVGGFSLRLQLDRYDKNLHSHPQLSVSVCDSTGSCIGWDDAEPIVELTVSVLNRPSKKCVQFCNGWKIFVVLRILFQVGCDRWRKTLMRVNTENFELAPLAHSVGI